MKEPWSTEVDSYHIHAGSCLVFVRCICCCPTSFVADASTLVLASVVAVLFSRLEAKRPSVWVSIRVVLKSLLMQNADGDRRMETR